MKYMTPVWRSVEVVSAIWGRVKRVALPAFCALLAVSAAQAGVITAGTPGKKDLLIAENGKSDAIIVVSPAAGEWERKAAVDLARTIELMTGAKPAMATNEAAIDLALKAKTPMFILGAAAIKVESGLSRELAKVSKKKTLLRADAIVLKRDGNRIFLAGSNDEAQYFAVSELMRRWGCRWFTSSDFGECIPTCDKLLVGDLDYAYGSAFEIRNFWVSWNGDYTGHSEFKYRNMMNTEIVPNGHCLATFTRDIAPGGDIFRVPIAEPATAEHVAKQIAARFAKGERIMLGMEDGVYKSDSPRDKELMSLQYDKYMMMPSMTDAFLEFYNNVARTLRKQYPKSDAKIGFLAYCNITIPPVRKMVAEKALVAYLAPIDIDPIHGMDDPNSPPRQEYRDMLYKWAQVMEGRVAIYDYDQSMLVWRDIPNPSIASIQQDFKHYRKAGILGVSTESRNALGTTFINLYLRGQLLWNPDADVNALLAEFYPAFYGPAAVPMSNYWNAIFKAWANTIVTEHEYFLIPAIYTPELVATLKGQLEAAEAAIQPLKGKASLSRNEKLYLDRMRFTRLSFGIIENYTAMVRAAATEGNYAAAVAAGARALAIREELSLMNPAFTTHNKPGMLESGSAWFPGEIQQYAGLAQCVAGTNGTLVMQLPLEWAFRRDKADQGLKEKWATVTPDLTYWKEKGATYTLDSRKDYPTNQWEVLRTDLYIQAQGVRDPDRQSYTGFGWYRTDLDLKADQVAGKVRLMFPGVFNECWLYVNGECVAERKLGSPMWWFNDYKFEWDVDLAGKLKPGVNSLALRFSNPHHFGGIFRRPFLYQAK